MAGGDHERARGRSARAAAVIEAHDVWRVYKVGSTEVEALRGVNLKIPSGRFVALKGRSGSGKTTLLNCIGGLDRPTSGPSGSSAPRWPG